MTNPTSNFGWQMPEPTDLVTNLPADFEVFGQAVDTDFVDLLGGTTGQVLSKTSNTDLDFTWIANDQGDITGVTAGTGISGGGTSGTVTVTNDMATTITAAGDIVVGTGSGTYDNLPIGTTAQVLTADTTVSPYKVKWATPSAGSGKILQVVQGTTTTLATIATGTFTDTNLTAQITPATTGSRILVMVTQFYYNGSTPPNTAIRIMRGSTVVYSPGDYSSINVGTLKITGSNEVIFTQAMHYVDSPSSTSTLTYKTQGATGNSSTAGFQQFTQESVITLLEIGA